MVKSIKTEFSGKCKQKENLQKIKFYEISHIIEEKNLRARYQKGQEPIKLQSLIKFLSSRSEEMMDYLRAHALGSHLEPHFQSLGFEI